MTTILNASSSSGLVATADTSAILQLQTGSTAAVTIDASQNVGIGTASPASSLDIRATDARSILRLTASTATNPVYQRCSNTGGFLYVGMDGSGGSDFGAGAYASAVWATGAYPMVFGTNSTERMRISSGGQVGIGGTSGGDLLDVIRATSNSTGGITLTNTDNTGYGAGISWNLKLNSTAGVWGRIYTEAASTTATFMAFQTAVGSTLAERMRINSGGSLLISTTSNTPGYFNTSTGTAINGGAIFTSSTGGSAFANPTSGGGTLMSFGTGNFWNTGTISTNNANTSYNTSSDYRLKENIEPMTGALTKVAALKPCTYTWKADGSDGEGFIAHELQEVCPHAVTGVKDAMETYTDDEGNEQTRIKPQGIDTSFLVATLTAAIQEQQALITDLTTRLAALEGAK